jgi:UDP-N-acetylmuramoylalanine--D-glutamate ligase
MRVNTSMRMPQIVMSALSRSVICPQTWVLGAGGQTGRSVVRYLISKHRPMMCLDDQPDAITQLGIDFPVLQGYCYSTSAWMERPHQWSQVREMIVSPGIAPAHPLIRWAVSQGIRVRGDIDVFFEEVDAPVIAVTGTNGKSTVTTLTKQAVSTW